jgi:hypothetical protein
MASVENMPLTGGLLVGQKTDVLADTIYRLGAVLDDQFIADSCIKRAYQGRPLRQAQARAFLPNVASRRRTSYDYLRLPDPDNKAGSANGLWNKTRQRLFKE